MAAQKRGLDDDLRGLNLTEPRIPSITTVRKDGSERHRPARQSDPNKRQRDCPISPTSRRRLMKLSIPLEVARLVCDYVDDEQDDFDGEVDETRNIGVVQSLKNLRLTSRSFAAAGGEVLFRRLDLRFSRSNICKDTALPQNHAKRHSDEQLCNYCFQTPRRMVELAASRFSPLVEGICFEINLDQEEEPLHYYIKTFSALQVVAKFTSLKVVRVIIRDENERVTSNKSILLARDLDLWIAMINHVTEGLVCLERLDLAYPAIYERRIANLRALQCVVELRQLCRSAPTTIIVPPPQAGWLSEEPFRAPEPMPAAPGLTDAARSEPGVFNMRDYRQLKLLNLKILEPQNLLDEGRIVQKIDFAPFQCSDLRILKLDSTWSENLHLVLDRAQFSLESFQLIDFYRKSLFFLNGPRQVTVWEAIFRSLRSCSKLKELSVEGCRWADPDRVAGPDTWSLQYVPVLNMPKLAFLHLDKIYAESDDLARLILANRTSLRYVAVRNCHLKMEPPFTRLLNHHCPQSRLTWMPVVEALKVCTQLKDLDFFELQSKFPGNGGTCCQKLSHDEWSAPDWLDGHVFDPRRFPEHLQEIIYSEYTALDSERDIFHLLGEILRSAYLGGIDRLTEAEKADPLFPHEPEPGTMNGYLVSLWPLADIRDGWARHDDVYPWDPINGLRAEEIMPIAARDYARNCQG